jgi:hypothetical protein
MNNQKAKLKYLDEKVFYNLNNLNDGFDAESIKYFNAEEFEIVLNRIKELNAGIYGIEPWLNGEYYDVLIHEDFGKKPTDAEWYYAAFNQFKSSNPELQFAASYYIPSIEN